MLIKCPECGKEISDKSKQCIHCGYPIDEQTDINEVYSVILKEYNCKEKDRNKTIMITKFVLEDRYNIPKEKSFSIVRNLPSEIISGVPSEKLPMIKQDLESIGCIVEFVKTNDDENKNLDKIVTHIKKINTPVTCPKCGSTNIQILRKKFSLLTGFATNKVERVCVNCKHTW